MNRKEIKEKALNILEKNYFKILFSIFVYIFIISCVDIIFSLLKFSSDVQEMFCYLLVLTLVSAPFNVGLSFYVLKIIRNEEYSFKDLIVFYKKIITIFLISLVIEILFLMGLTLLFVPGVIVFLCYSFVNLVVADGEYSVIDALRESRELIYGFKIDYFKFLLSFIGWLLIILLTFGTAFIFVIPYFIISNTIYYDNLKTKKMNN